VGNKQMERNIIFQIQVKIPAYAIKAYGRVEV
jgi:hypothetical protein